MARLTGVDLPVNKNIDVALTYIYGIGLASSKEMLEKLKIDPFTKVKDLAEADIVALREAIKGVLVEGDLRREQHQNIKRLIDLGTYRGNRHRKNLPAHGQRSKTNARTRRGRRKTVGAGKKKEEGKT